MLFTKYFPKLIAVIGLVATITHQLPAFAQYNFQTNESPLDPSKAAQAVLDHPLLNKNVGLVAQATSGTASEISDVAVASTMTGKKQKYELLITDSLWGNLILDLAYQRDPQLRKIAKRINLVNLGTMATITGIAGGTLAQGIIALSVLNPPSPQFDSYLPGSIGVGFAGLTLITFVGRTALNHVFTSQLRKKQLDIKHKVESVIARIESSHGESTDAQNDLIALIGERATNEFLQLWRSSNAIATSKLPNISLNAPAVLAGHQHM